MIVTSSITHLVLVNLSISLFLASIPLWVKSVFTHEITTLHKKQMTRTLSANASKAINFGSKGRQGLDSVTNAWCYHRQSKEWTGNVGKSANAADVTSVIRPDMLYFGTL